MGRITYFYRNYNSAYIDDVLYNGSIDIAGVQINHSTEDTRYIIIGSVVGTTIETIWSNFLTSGKILIMKRVGDNYYGWRSL